MDTPIMAETIAVTGHGEEIEAYCARPLGTGPFPGVVVIHHMPGYDRSTKEIVRAFAVYGYTAVCPNLHYRYAPGAGQAQNGDPDAAEPSNGRSRVGARSHMISAGDAAAAAMEAGGVPDDQCVGDVQRAVRYLRAQPTSNGKVGVIGYCSGGRQAYVVAGSGLEIE